MAGMPRGGSSTCKQSDNCPTLSRRKDYSPVLCRQTQSSVYTQKSQLVGLLNFYSPPHFPPRVVESTLQNFMV